MTTVKLSANFVRTKDWFNPKTRRMERIITHPNGRREIIPLQGNGELINQVEEELKIKNG